MITLAVPTYTRFDLLPQCIASARAGTLPPSRVLVIDNSGGDCPATLGAEMIMGRQPQSVAKAWNDAAGLAGSQGWLIIANDDLTFVPDTIARLVDTAQANPRAGIVSPTEGQRFSCFLLRYAAYLDVGPFDEQFKMAYFEDNDYAYRLRLAGWGMPIAPSDVRHVGSATLSRLTRAQMAQKHAAWDWNSAYYIKKWGNGPDQERYQTPFGGVG